MIIYAVWIERDRGEYDYVRERKGNSWTDSSPVMIFDTKEAAQNLFSNLASQASGGWIWPRFPTLQNDLP